MQFKHPELLYGLFAVLIPIIIHLFQLRKFKKVEFTNVRLLQQVKLQTRKSSQIKKWLTLLARMLAIASIIFAFAQPYFSAVHNPDVKKEMVIYLDNSFSMQAKGSKGSLLQQATQDLLNYLPEDQKFTLFTNNNLYKEVTLTDIKKDLLNTQYTPEQLPYNVVLQKAKNSISKEKNTVKQTIIISDFQKNSDFTKQDTLSNSQLSMVQLQPQVKANKSIDSMYLSHNKQRELFLNVVVSATGKVPETTPVAVYNELQLIGKTTLTFNTQRKSIAQFKIEENQQIKGKVEIEDNYLRFDNSFYFTINPTDKIKVVAISNDDSAFLQKIFTEDEFLFTNQSLENFNYNLLSDTNFLICNSLEEIPVSLSNAIVNFIAQGGHFCFIPSSQGNMSSYNALLSNLTPTPFLQKVDDIQKITAINFEHPLYQGVFNKEVSNFQYPQVTSYFQTPATNGILYYNGKQPFLFESKKAYIFTASLSSDNSNFQNSPLIVPTFYNMAKQSLQIGAIYYTIGQKNSYDLPVASQGEETIRLRTEDEEIIPLQQSFSNKIKITTQENPEKAGIYSATLRDQTLQYLAYNYNAKESYLNYYKPEDLQNQTYFTEISTLFDKLKQDFEVKDLWKWFVIFALLFLFLEIVLLKFLP
ncbi:BatA and WFA domain-containing protein [Aquimarina sp. ERC-38]|uniref:vWA domain-containing protein n=1 Tax=Aquimarina sp. ERC-38 TaxID=2949996 RepID=UPI002247BD53|nr:BatA and WFA domain-containing protein [Aquimarina sp. ERC-38]UZO79675.1 BatA and WFA domain-containing protein [Aquimarina sp. ERC-38]